MIFLDTCVWFELLGVRTPVKSHEIQQAKAATTLLQEILNNKEEIATCQEQLVELISAIEKAHMKAASRERKGKNLSGIGNLKEFRELSEFEKTKKLCESVLDDMEHFAKVHSIGNYDLDYVLQCLDLADINDCLYYDYCTRKNIDFYTFDSDVKRLGDNEYLHCYESDEDRWS